MKRLRTRLKVSCLIYVIYVYDTLWSLISNLHTTFSFLIAMKEEDDDGAFAEDKEEYIEDLEEMEYEGELNSDFVL